MDLTPRSCRSDSAASIASSEVLENLLELLELDFDEFCMLQEIKNEFSYTAMREIVPIDIYRRHCASELETLDKTPRLLSDRLWGEKSLWLLCVHPTNIVMLDAETVAQSCSYYNLDLVELRSLLHHLSFCVYAEKLTEWQEEMKLRLYKLLLDDYKGNLPAQVLRHPFYEVFRGDIIRQNPSAPLPIIDMSLFSFNGYCVAPIIEPIAEPVEEREVKAEAEKVEVIESTGTDSANLVVIEEKGAVITLPKIVDLKALNNVELFPTIKYTRSRSFSALNPLYLATKNSLRKLSKQKELSLYEMESRLFSMMRKSSQNLLISEFHDDVYGDETVSPSESISLSSQQDEMIEELNKLLSWTADDGNSLNDVESIDASELTLLKSISSSNLYFGIGSTNSQLVVEDQRSKPLSNSNALSSFEGYDSNEDNDRIQNTLESTIDSMDVEEKGRVSTYQNNSLEIIRLQHNRRKSCNDVDLFMNSSINSGTNLLSKYSIFDNATLRVQFPGETQSSKFLEYSRDYECDENDFFCNIARDSTKNGLPVNICSPVDDERYEEFANKFESDMNRLMDKLSNIYEDECIHPLDH